MIDESPAEDAFKQVLRGKLEALLGLSEATDCRRVRLLRYFGEASQACHNCDNCLQPPKVWDATDAARKLLSTVYRVQQMSGFGFGAGHVVDVLRGKLTDKVTQRGHKAVSTFGIGADLSETQWRAVLRQLMAIGAVEVDAQAFNTLKLTESARAVLKGEVPVRLRASELPTHTRKSRRAASERPVAKAAVALDDVAQASFMALKAWRAEVAKAHNLPAYVIFHDATLAAIAQSAPQSLEDLQGISGMGERKLAAYGSAVLEVVASGGVTTNPISSTELIHRPL
jgi:ATP-dependent DNA helicase RecQ